MKRTLLITVGVCIALGTATGQVSQRRASIVGGGNSNEGKCTVEVVVDGAAEVTIRGDRATLRNLNGGAPQWRRFECTSPMPVNPASFRFQGVDGRGRQELVRNPDNGGAAVIRIEDSEGGSEGYTFDVLWSGAGYGGNQPYGSADRSRPYSNDGNDSYRGVFGDYSDSNTAIAACQNAVRQEARRLGVRSIDFRRERMEDEPGNRDTVRGRFFATDNHNQEQAYRYSCTVNSRNGRVSNVDVQPVNGAMNGGGNGGAFGGYQNRRNASPVTACQQAAEQRILQDGYRSVSFGNSTLNNRAGRVEGTARASGRNGTDGFAFACDVDNNGGVQGIDVQRR